jgi:hypothetical protein
VISCFVQIAAYTRLRCHIRTLILDVAYTFVVEDRHLIDTREELTYALHEAAELEHGLLIQYLFSAFSLKKRLDEGITGEQQELIRKWKGQLLKVAREEMVHLGTVCNLLSAIGAAPHFTRPNFPQEATKYYPFSFTLSRFSDETLYHFIRFELPKGEKPPQPPQIRDSLLKKIDSKMLVSLFVAGAIVRNN